MCFVTEKLMCLLHIPARVTVTYTAAGREVFFMAVDQCFSVKERRRHFQLSSISVSYTASCVTENWLPFK